MDRRIKVLDSTALILGFTELLNDRLVAPRKVLEEAKHGGAEYRALASMEGRMIEILDPDQEYIRKIEKVAEDVGEKGLSMADVSVLALALQLSRKGCEVSIITSDYSIQNLASILGIDVEPILHRGIVRTITWITCCGICGWEGDERPGKPCPVCGHSLKRRPKRREEDKDRV